MAALAASIQAVGLLQPVLVRELDDEAESYELIAGERRWRAARRAGLQTIPVLVQVADDVASLEQALVENLHRVDLNALEEAAAYQQLIDEFGLTHEQVATRVGKSRATVTNTLRLLQLPAGAQRALAERDHLGRPRPGPARDAGPGPPGGAGRADRRRGVDRAGRRGAGPRGRRRAAGRAADVPEPPRPEPLPRVLPLVRPTERRAGRRRASCPSPACSSSRSCSRPTSTPGSRSTSRTGGAGWSSSSPPSRTSSGSTGPWSVTAASRSSRNRQGSVQLHPQPVHDVVDCHCSPAGRFDRVTVAGARRTPSGDSGGLQPGLSITGDQSQEASAQCPRASARAAARAGARSTTGGRAHLDDDRGHPGLAQHGHRHAVHAGVGDAERLGDGRAGPARPAGARRGTRRG